MTYNYCTTVSQLLFKEIMLAMIVRFTFSTEDDKIVAEIGRYIIYKSKFLWI